MQAVQAAHPGSAATCPLCGEHMQERPLLLRPPTEEREIMGLLVKHLYEKARLDACASCSLLCCLHVHIWHCAFTGSYCVNVYSANRAINNVHQECVSNLQAYKPANEDLCTGPPDMLPAKLARWLDVTHMIHRHTSRMPRRILLHNRLPVSTKRMRYHQHLGPTEATSAISRLKHLQCVEKFGRQDHCDVITVWCQQFAQIAPVAGKLTGLQSLEVLIPVLQHSRNAICVMQNVVAKVPNLQELSLPHLEDISDSAFATACACLSSMTQLQTLHIGHADLTAIRFAYLWNMLPAMKRLTVLKLIDCDVCLPTSACTCHCVTGAVLFVVMSITHASWLLSVASQATCFQPVCK